MSGPEGFHKSSDCRNQKFYICQNDAVNADFSSPPKGENFTSKYFYFKCPYILVDISALGIFYLPIHNILESYIHSPDYLNSHPPHDYEQVNII